MKVNPRETMPADGPTRDTLPAADGRLVERLRAGDADAGHCFVHDYYPGIYRYLLYLTGRRELAEDLTQETFLQAWRHLDQFAGRAPLRVWLHRIAHREFLQSLRQARSPSRQPETERRSLEELGEAAAPVAEDWRDAVELCELLRSLPVEEFVAVDQGRRVLMPAVRELTPEAALRTARKLFPPVTEAMLQAWRRYWPDVTAEQLIPQPEEIAPTELDLVIVYIPSLSTAHLIRWVRTNQSWGQL